MNNNNNNNNHHHHHHLWKIHRTSCNISPFVCNVHLYYVSNNNNNNNNNNVSFVYNIYLVASVVIHSQAYGGYRECI